MEAVISCVEGLECSLIDELARNGYDSVYLKPAKVKATITSYSDIVYLNLILRQAHSVYYLVTEKIVSTLEEIKNICSSIEFSVYIGHEQTFGVRGLRIGKHGFTSMDMAGVVGGRIIDCFARKGQKISVNLDEPDVVFIAEISGDDFILMIDTTGVSLHKRYNLEYKHQAPLKSTIAAAMIAMSSFCDAKNLLDPMAGGGTIPMEAAMFAGNIFPGYLKRDYAFFKLRFVPDIYESVWKELSTKIKHDVYNIGAADKNQLCFKGMKQNISSNQNIPHIADIKVYLGDAREMNYNSSEYSMIISNLPYGNRLSNPRVVDDLYYAFVSCARSKNVSEIVLITPRRKSLISALEKEGYVIEKMFNVLNGRITASIIKGVLPE